MSHYEERLEEDLGKIHQRIADMARDTSLALKNAVHALQTGDHELASKTILGDHEINRTMREIDDMAHGFLAVHLPSGGHLRFLSSVIRANIAFERIGDYAVTIARVSEQLSAPPSGEIGRELERISNQAQTMLRQAISAFDEQNAEMAKATMVMEREMEYDLDTVYGELTQNTEMQKVKGLLGIFAVLSYLKRTADQAKNICEDTVFAVTGETKAAKVYNIVFLDEDNATLGQMAEAMARKTFPNSGNYASAGRNPAAAIDATMERFMREHGCDLSGARPKPIDLTHQELAEKHVVVSLQGPVKSYLPELPFHTTGVEWELDGIPTGQDESATNAEWESLYRDVAVRVRDLMETLRGKGAN
ncbi:MAG: phosphate signaling complex protein PhoU [Gammaproteobacteria bacterium]|jgi:phosphate transport system protein|nr:phosphate signaling complex protein PhoU [Gammaproteobacteria bacterium]